MNRVDDSSHHSLKNLHLRHVRDVDAVPPSRPLVRDLPGERVLVRRRDALRDRCRGRLRRKGLGVGRLRRRRRNIVVDLLLLVWKTNANVNDVMESGQVF